MRKPLPTSLTRLTFPFLFALALLGALAGIAAPAVWLADDLPAATTSAYTTHNPNIRDHDGHLTSQQLTTDPQVCEVYIADGTGEAFTAPTSAAVIKSATLSLVSVVRGSAVADGPNGTCKTTKPGLYQVCSRVNSGTGANTATITVDVFRKDGAGSFTIISPSIEGVATTLTANPTFSAGECGLVEVTPAQAAATGGVSFAGYITASTGNPVVKQFRLRMVKIDDTDGGARP